MRADLCVHVPICARWGVYNYSFSRMNTHVVTRRGTTGVCRDPVEILSLYFLFSYLYRAVKMGKGMKSEAREGGSSIDRTTV